MFRIPSNSFWITDKVVKCREDVVATRRTLVKEKYNAMAITEKIPRAITVSRRVKPRE